LGHPYSLHGRKELEEHRIAEDEVIFGGEEEEPSDALRLAKGKMKTV